MRKILFFLFMFCIMYFLVGSSAFADYYGCLGTNGKIGVIVGDCSACPASTTCMTMTQIGAQGPKGDKGDQGIQGIQGPKGDTGDQGLMGPAGPAGSVGATGPQGLTWQGDWDSTKTYALNDVVHYAGSSWISLVDSNLDNAPGAKPRPVEFPALPCPEPSIPWAILAQQGDQGPAGADGAVGPAGPQGLTGEQGRQGIQGPKGEQGTQGPPGVNVAAGQRCTGGMFVVGFDQQGNIICSKLLYAIGDTGPAGGIVFYTIDGGLHGIEAAPEDQSVIALGDLYYWNIWGCEGRVIAGADGTAVWTGAQNTADILAVCSAMFSLAAKMAHDYTLNGYSDWFLPSKDELNLLYLQKDVVGGFTEVPADTNTLYWSSSEYNNSGTHAWLQDFSDGSQYFMFKSQLARVRAVRAF
jgi:hypothetical protein